MSTTTPPRKSLAGRIAKIAGAMFLAAMVLGGIAAVANGDDRPRAAAIVPAPVVTAAPPLAPVPLAPVLDDAAGTACDLLGSAVSSAGAAKLLAADDESYRELARNYTLAVQGRYYLTEDATANGLVRDSADLLVNTASSPDAARMLAMDVTASRCFGAGWTPDR